MKQKDLVETERAQSDYVSYSSYIDEGFSYLVDETYEEALECYTKAMEIADVYKDSDYADWFSFDVSHRIDHVQAKIAAKSSATSGYINGHMWVDLGLPSGVRWANCNVGAMFPNERGSANETDCEEWGKEWRIPFRTEFQELADLCEWSRSGSCYEITGPNGKSIFLPGNVVYLSLRLSDKKREDVILADGIDREIVGFDDLYYYRLVTNK